MQVNPVVKKDLKVLSRSMKLAWAVFAFEAVLGIIFMFALTVMSLDFDYNYGYADNYSSLQAMFPIIGGVEVGIVALIMPIMTASSISGEKERQTFDILLTTPIKTFSIIVGKNISAVLRVMLFIVASIPLMAVAFTIGGTSWLYLLVYLLEMFVFATFAGAIGILASTLTKKSITAIILSYVMYGFFYGITFVPLIFASILDGVVGDMEVLLVFGMFFLMLNPVFHFVELFFIMFNDGDGLVTELTDMPAFFNDIIWLIVSVIILIGLSILVMYLASRIIDPIKAKNKKVNTYVG